MPTTPLQRDRPVLQAVATALVGALLLLPVVFSGHPAVRIFTLMYVGILMEALPFMLLGSCVSGLLEVYVSRERLLAYLPRNPVGVTVAAAALGLVLPVCECAVVPVVRRLSRKGLPLSACVAYLIAGPILNPIVFFSTFMAYRWDLRIALTRMLFGFVIAIILGLVMRRIFKRQYAFLDPNKTSDETAAGTMPASPIVTAMRHASDEFMRMAPYLMIGAALAALAQTLLDRQFLQTLSAMPILPSFVMMLMAILLNLCSEADAFIAASFRGIIPLPAQMTFILTGPIVDLKLILMYRTMFTPKAIVILVGLSLAALTLSIFALEAIGGKI